MAYYQNSQIQSTIALAQSERAKKLACESLEQSFEPKTATIQQKQDYAECMRLLYPQEMSAGDVFALKIVLVIAFIGMGIGGAIGARDDVPTGFIFGLIGFLIAPIAAGIVGGIGYAALWLLGVV